MLVFFFFNDTATTEIYTLSLHDALPIYRNVGGGERTARILRVALDRLGHRGVHVDLIERSEEHTSELQSRFDLVCRLLLEKKNNKYIILIVHHHNMQVCCYKLIKYQYEF